MSTTNSNLPLSDREQRILQCLKTKDRYSYNDLLRELVGYASRKNLRKSLDNLTRMGLIYTVKRSSGQKDVYVLSDNLEKFGNKLIVINMLWKDFENHFEILSKFISEEKCGSKKELAAFIALTACKAAMIVQAIFLIDEREIHPRMKNGLIQHYMKELTAVFDKTSKLLKDESVLIGDVNSLLLTMQGKEFAEEFLRSLLKFYNEEIDFKI